MSRPVTQIERLNAAVALIAEGRFGDAAALCREALVLEPNDVQAKARLGEAMLKGGDAAGAVDWLEQSFSVPEATLNLGGALLKLKRPAEAARVSERALALHPRLAPLWANLGVARLELGEPASAAEAFERALQLDPAFAKAARGRAMALHRLGAEHLKAGRAAQAAQACRQALAQAPDHAPAYIGLGAALRRLGEREDAVRAYRQAIDLKPDSAMAHYNLANVLQELSDGPEAGEAYERAIALRPDWPSAHFNHGVWLLSQGRYEQGWVEYEWRWRTEAFKGAARELAAPTWTGQPLEGRTIFIWAEQGLGDQIQTARYVRRIAAMGGKVVLEAPTPLKSLFARLDGVEAVLDVQAPPPPHDYQCPDLSLPRAFGTRVEDIPVEIPYLRADPDRIAFWRERLPEGLRVGVAWQGNPSAPVEPGRSFPLAALEPLAAIPGVRLVSLQRGHGLDQLQGAPFAIHALGPAFDSGDMAETAAVLEGLDLVIACDTAVAHLAGALGRPTWIAMKHDNDWRWLRGRSDSPWYPSARLYRQAERGCWDDLFQRMATDLARKQGKN